MDILLTIQTFFVSHPFTELAAVVAVVVAITALMRVLKQPLIIGYIIAGVLFSPNVLNLLQNTEAIEVFSHIGIALLLFMVGLGLNPVVIKDLGKASLIVGFGQVIFTTAIGMGIVLLLGFDWITSLYVAVALAFSSTIIVVKFLSDKGVLDELYGKISIGMLIVQDILAMIILLVLASLPAGGEAVNRSSFSFILIGKIVAVVIVTYVLMKYILPHMMHFIARSQEFLLIFAIGRCFVFAAGMEAIGFSLEIGALLAGLSLAALPYRFEISSKMKPLRDFFIVLFFVFLGSQLQFSDLSAYVIPTTVLSLFVLIGNPFIVMVLMGLLGYKKKNGMMVGFTVAQISEFSFILMGLGFTLGHVTNIDIISMVTIVGLITIAGSSYYFTYADIIYTKFSKYFTIFERKNFLAEKHFNTYGDTYDIVVFGNHRTGEGIVEMLQKHNKKFVIVDYDPQVISKLEKQGLPCMYGDAGDIETLQDIKLQYAKMIISTVHDYDANSLILQQAKRVNEGLITILSANKVGDAELLYEGGANYVLVPHVIGGHHAAMLIENYEYDVQKYAKHKIEHYNTLLS